MGQHSNFRFSVTLQTDDLAIVYCLRALSDYSQDTGNSRITWGGTKDEDWRAADRRMTVRFSQPAYREDFVATATRLLPNGSWREVSRSDQDPATPQS
jgi:hypothetical protein